MDYTETIDFLFSSLPMYQRVGKSAYKSDLDTTIRLDNHFGNPHRLYKSVHIAGTNGKGSVSHMLASVLQNAGYRTGLYTSPHLSDFRERIRVNGEMISKDYVSGFVNENKSIIKLLSPSFFEMTAAMAMLYFRDKNIDIAIIETGMGGRLDSTNIVNPILSVITNIGFDHSRFLGDTLPAIAGEKAGIIKNNVPVVIGEYRNETRKVFEKRANETGSEIYFASDNYSVRKLDETDDHVKQCVEVKRNNKVVLNKLWTDMNGDYQLNNLLTFFQAVELLKDKWRVDKTHIQNGLYSVRTATGFSGRWHISGNDPLVICDSGHNVEAIGRTMRHIKQIERENLHFILGVVSDKDIAGMLDIMPRNARYYFTKASVPRAMDENKLRSIAAKNLLKGEAYCTVKEAYNAAITNAGKNDLVFIGGSTFIVADFLILTDNN
ncbi:MAG: bifunctional folylpolyglutamate synthase/dihydrofolate synthase [Bacteroidales bacterium]|nr:bifunctional folylpolyglutamate synthase/dihydrofolate synthase [Bacteroidales bacterium]